MNLAEPIRRIGILLRGIGVFLGICFAIVVTVSLAAQLLVAWAILMKNISNNLWG